MKKWISLGLSLLIIVSLSVICMSILNFGVNIYNDMVNGFQSCQKGLAQIDVEMQRRYDLLPNLFAMVKSYNKHENKTLKEVIEARASATQIKLTVKNIKEKQQVEENLGTALSKLLVNMEQYPKLMANENYKQVISDIKETENYIAQARINYNDVAFKYNSFIKKFPMNILAQWYKFNEVEMFKLINKDAKNAPKFED